MNPIALLALSAGLSTDAFAASIARGGREREARLRRAAASGAVFGAAEGSMCLAGWLLAHSFAEAIRAIDHWVALGLLSVIGVRMILEGLKLAESGASEGGGAPRRASIGATVLTAIGTSIDSAAVGVALALASVGAYAALVIGLFSFAASTAGFLIGPWAGRRLGSAAEVIGGLILIGLGVSIFASHTAAG